MNFTIFSGRTPHGVRGLKSICVRKVIKILKSHPSRGAWIEISNTTYVNATKSSRTPHGVRGLKSKPFAYPIGPKPSHPSRGAWIEI